jgi:hypothetical protein
VVLSASAAALGLLLPGLRALPVEQPTHKLAQAIVDLFVAEARIVLALLLLTFRAAAVVCCTRKL